MFLDYKQPVVNVPETPGALFFWGIFPFLCLLKKMTHMQKQIYFIYPFLKNIRNIPLCIGLFHISQFFNSLNFRVPLQFFSPFSIFFFICRPVKFSDWFSSSSRKFNFSTTGKVWPLSLFSPSLRFGFCEVEKVCVCVRFFFQS